jgi:hypothetical protein
MNKDNVYQILIENSTQVKVNIEDLFKWGIPETLDININLFEQYKDIIEEHQDKGLYAFLSMIKNQHVLDFYRNEEYEIAYQKIKQRELELNLTPA